MENILIETRQGVLKGEDIVFLCPAHPDRNPSARYHVDKKVWYCDVCQSKGGMKDLAERLNAPTPPPSAWGTAPTTPIVKEFLYDEAYVNRCLEALFATGNSRALHYLTNTRGLGFECIRQHRLGFDATKDAITIPIMDGTRLTGIKYRHLEPVVGSRYSAASGTKPTLFGFPNTAPVPSLALYEGELDFISASTLDPTQPACATMGAGNWKPEWTERVANVERIYIAFDGDAPGNARAGLLAQTLGPHRCYRLDISTVAPECHDINDLLVKRGVEEARRLYRLALDQAVPMGAPLVARFGHVIPEMVEYYRSGAYKGLSTGFPELDELFGGFKPGTITMLMAYPGDGKTTLAAAIGHKMMTLHGMPIGIGSFDTPPATTVAPKVMSFHMNRNIDVDIKNGKMTVADLESASKALDLQDKIHWLLPEQIEKPDIKVVLDGIRLAYARGVRFILIDYLQVLVDETDLSDVKAKMQALKAIKKECSEVVILLVVQPKRKGAGVHDHPLSMQDMKGGSVIEETADTILALDAKRYVRTLKVRSDIVLCPTESKVPVTFDKKNYSYTFGNVQLHMDSSDGEEVTLPWAEVGRDD